MSEPDLEKRPRPTPLGTIGNGALATHNVLYVRVDALKSG